MTRYTNLGRKRTYVTAEFNYRDDEPQQESEPSSLLANADSQPNADPTETANTATDERPKKRARRNRKKRGTVEDGSSTEDKADTNAGEVEEGLSTAAGQTKTKKQKLKEKHKIKRKKGVPSVSHLA
jgi:hypothetical protein